MSRGAPVNERIAARRAAVAAARRRRLLRRTATVLLLAGIVVGALALERSSLVALASIDVLGEDRLTEQEVLDAAEVELGVSVLRVRADRVQARVEALPLVAAATVERDGPLGLVITVTEVAPALTARFDDGSVILDAAGLVLGPGEAAGTPVVEVPGTAPPAGGMAADDPLLASIHDVVLDLPGPIAALVASTRVTTDGEVRLTLADGTEVRWGDETRGDEKARALGAVLEDLDGRAVTAIDVRAPGAPTVRP